MGEGRSFAIKHSCAVVWLAARTERDWLASVVTAAVLLQAVRISLFNWVTRNR
jgi:hypothetical protein